jgi:hypothetical protein
MFHLWYVFRTEPGWDLFASGSLNCPKDGIAPLIGVIEPDWLPYPFTMNWQMTRPGTVRFENEEPVCMIFPVPHGTLQDIEPEIIDLDGMPESGGVPRPRRTPATAIAATCQGTLPYRPPPLSRGSEFRGACEDRAGICAGNCPLWLRMLAARVSVGEVTVTFQNENVIFSHAENGV